MSLSNVGIVYRKELRDMLRDRRTLISMVVVPLLLMPVLTIGFGTLAAKLVGKAMEEVPTVMLVGGDDSPIIVEQLRAVKDIQILPATPDYIDQISNKKVRAAVEIPPGFDAALDRGETVTVQIDMYEGEIRSGFGASRVQKFFDQVRQKTIAARLQTRNLPESLVKPFTVKQKNVAPPEKVGGSTFGGIIPYFIIILCLQGAMHPAIDLTAGEKERGTIETILCSPVSRTHLVLGKFLMVLTASIATAILALCSMSGSFLYAKTALASLGGRQGGLQVAISLKAVIAVFGMILPLAVLFSAGLLTIALFAKSYKEAQSYIAPLMIVVILPAVAALLPGVELNTRLALVPILNMSLIGKEIIAGTYHWNYIGLIFGSSCVYAAVALFLAVKLFQREEVLFRS